MATTQLLHLIQLRTRRVADWLRDQVQLAWIDTLDSDYRDWKPEGQIYERLIR